MKLIKIDSITDEILATSSVANGGLKPNTSFLKVKNIVLLGGPGCGKGTQGKLISDFLDVSYIVAGDIVRKAAKKNEDMAKIINSGNLLSDDDINKIIRTNISTKINYIFDGYPRSLNQAQFLDSYKNVSKAIWIDVPDNILVERLKERAKSSARKDDANEEIIKRRLEIYHQLLIPILEWYKKDNRLIRIDGNSSIKSVFKQIKKSL